MGAHETSRARPLLSTKDTLPGEGLINEGRRGRKPGASHSSEKLTDLLESVTVLKHLFCLYTKFCKNLWVVNSFQILF